MLYDYILTAFKVILGVISKFGSKMMIYSVVAGFAIFSVWIFLALIFGKQRKFGGNCQKLLNFVKKNSITGENIEKIDAMASEISPGFSFGWKKFKSCGKGLPSDHIKRGESLEVESNTKNLNHVKSMLKTYVILTTILLFIVNLAYIETLEETFSAYLLAEAMLLPFFYMFLLFIFYFVYLSINDQIYKLNISTFYELLDVLDASATEYLKNNPIKKESYFDFAKAGMFYHGQNGECEELHNEIAEQVDAQDVKESIDENEEDSESIDERLDDKIQLETDNFEKVDVNSGIVVKTDAEIIPDDFASNFDKQDENTSFENIEPENVEHENIEFENIEFESVEPENVEHENIEFESVKPENVADEAKEEIVEENKPNEIIEQSLTDNVNEIEERPVEEIVKTESANLENKDFILDLKNDDLSESVAVDSNIEEISLESNMNIGNFDEESKENEVLEKDEETKEDLANDEKKPQNLSDKYDFFKKKNIEVENIKQKPQSENRAYIQVDDGYSFDKNHANGELKSYKNFNDADSIFGGIIHNKSGLKRTFIPRVNEDKLEEQTKENAEESEIVETLKGNLINFSGKKHGKGFEIVRNEQKFEQESEKVKERDINEEVVSEPEIIEEKDSQEEITILPDNNSEKASQGDEIVDNDEKSHESIDVESEGFEEENLTENAEKKEIFGDEEDDNAFVQSVNNSTKNLQGNSNVFNLFNESKIEQDDNSKPSLDEKPKKKTKKEKIKKEKRKKVSEETKKEAIKRGRPKKQIFDETMTIKTDEEFEKVLSRAEKLMKKSDEGLSQSQSKRIEKELQMLIDAMNKYKENN